MPADRSSTSTCATGEQSRNASASPSDPARPRSKPKKPPACDRCKAKRVLCHPSPTGCPRCVEAEILCTTTPVARKKPQGRARTAVSRAPPSASPALVPAPTFSTPAASTTPSTHDFHIIASTSRLERDLVGNEPLFELSDSIVDDLIPRAGLRFTHPLVQQSDLFLAPPKTVGELDALAPDLRELAYCALAAGALASFHSAIIGSRSDNPTSMAAAERLGPDLRDFGRRRLGAFRALRDEAMRRAKAGDTFYTATPTHAAVCWALDFLFAVDPPVSSSRPYLSIYYAHVRVLAPLRTLGEAQKQSTQWAMQLAVDHLTAIGDDSSVLASHDLDKIIVMPELTLEAYVHDLEDALGEGVRTMQWPAVGTYAGLSVRAALELHEHLSSSALARSRRAGLDERAVLSTLGRIELLRDASIALVAHTDRLLEAGGAAPDRSLFRTVPFSKIQALKSTRFFAAVGWTALVLPLYHDLQHRQATSALTPPSSSASISARFARDRLEVHVGQARAYGFAALEAVMAAIERTPHICFWTHLQPRLLPQWVEFLLGEYDAGHARAMGDRLVPTCQQLSATLLKIGYIYSNPHLDHLVERLDMIVHLETLNAALQVPLDNPLSFLTLLSTDPAFSDPPASTSTSTSGPSAPVSAPSVSMRGTELGGKAAQAFAPMASGCDGIPVGEGQLWTPDAMGDADWIWTGLL